MAARTRNELIKEMITDLKTLLALDSATTAVPAPIPAVYIKRGQKTVRDLPDISLYVWEMPEKVQQVNRVKKRTINLSIECYFNNKAYYTDFGSTDDSEIANIILIQLQTALDKMAFDRDPISETDNQIFYNTVDKAKMAVQITAEVKYATGY
jgi:hypothetical protein